MTDVFYIAWQYIRHNKFKTIILVACISVIIFLPVALELLLDESEKQLMSRAEATPLLVGAKGSALDLVMNSLYFDDEIPELITMEEADRIQETGLALPVPVYIRFKAREYPIIGTTLDYFHQRNLVIEQGRNLAIIGECVLGARVAEELGLAVDSSLVSSPESMFDLAGVYPLKMNIVGILEPTHTADDLAIFVDLKTTWIIEGLGHGHQDVTQIDDPSLIFERNEQNVSATPKLLKYNEITAENIDSFHFHSDPGKNPVTAILVFPNDFRSEVILRGRYVSDDQLLQIIKPVQVIDGLLQNIFRIKNVLDAVIIIVGLATIMAMVLVFALSIRIRQREIQTIFKLGCRKGTISYLLAAEIGIVMAFSLVICSAMILAIWLKSQAIVRLLFIQ